MAKNKLQSEPSVWKSLWSNLTVQRILNGCKGEYLTFLLKIKNSVKKSLKITKKKQQQNIASYNNFERTSSTIN